MGAVQGRVGMALINSMNASEVKKAKLSWGTVILEDGTPVNYLARGPEDAEEALVLLHGWSGSAPEGAELVNKINVPPNVRVVLFEAEGMGKDIERAWKIHKNNGRCVSLCRSKFPCAWVGVDAVHPPRACTHRLSTGSAETPACRRRSRIPKTNFARCRSSSRVLWHSACLNLT